MELLGPCLCAGGPGWHRKLPILLGFWWVLGLCAAELPPAVTACHDDLSVEAASHAAAARPAVPHVLFHAPALAAVRVASPLLLTARMARACAAYCAHPKHRA